MAKEHGLQWHGHLLKACSRGELPAANLRSSKSEPRAWYRRTSVPTTGAELSVAAVNGEEWSSGPPTSRSAGFEKLGESCARFSVLRI
jgi:hypothetical protein